MSEPIKVYLAGPDVFYADAIERGERLKAVCEGLGMVGLFPLDNQVPDGLGPQEMALWIAQVNMAALYEADVVVANLELFRGSEPDSGTAFECGVAVALGKPLFAYCDDAHLTMRDQVQTDEDGRCVAGLHVEDFGLPRNLMMAAQWEGVYTTPDAALMAASQLMGAAPRRAFGPR